MSNTLVIRVMSTMLLNGRAEGPVVVTASDAYGSAYRDNWSGDKDFLEAFPTQQSLINEVAGWEELSFEGTNDSDNEFGIAIEGVTNIIIEGYPVDGVFTS